LKYDHVGASLADLVSLLLIALIRLYQAAVRPVLIGSCKFHPTCSEYAVEAVRLHGPWRGAVMAARRLGRCRPLSSGGYDPVPVSANRIPPAPKC
jgi:putative membrane protein insertion efficiency factor